MSHMEPGPIVGTCFLDQFGQRKLATRQGAPGSVYGERIIDGYRLWDPFRSKLAALLLKSRHPESLSLSPEARVRYLGAATGTTVSHISDIVREGLVYAVEFSPRAMRDLLRLAEARSNVIPILADAAQPQIYGTLLEKVDLVYQDLAQKNQTQIASLNCARYLKEGRVLVLMLKTRSIDVTASPQAVLDSEIQKLEGLETMAVMDLLPYHQDHWAIVAKKV
jgi:fibrillarin-like pre-rRNA processing protein